MNWKYTVEGGRYGESKEDSRKNVPKESGSKEEDGAERQIT